MTEALSAGTDNAVKVAYMIMMDRSRAGLESTLEPLLIVRLDTDTVVP